MVNNKEIIFCGSEYFVDDSVWKNNPIVITGNLLLTDNSKYIPYNYFLDYPPFVSGDVDINKIVAFNLDKVVLCYNRRPHEYRKILVWYMLNNKMIWNNSLVSLGIKSHYSKSNFDIINAYLHNNELSNEIVEYFESNKEDIKFSDYSLTNHLGLSMIEEEHNRTFVSLVTESSIDNNVLFISEKTYKPIFAQQPFIIMGNPNTLEYLRSIGFKTFSDWWDESYDNELDVKKRMDKIFNIVESLCSKSLDELTQMRMDMKEILIHNYKLFLTLESADDRLKELGYGKNKRNKIL